MNKKQDIKSYIPSLSHFSIKKMEDMEQLAVVSHYLQNWGISENEEIINEAKDILQQKFGYTINDLTDGYIMTELFNEVTNVPFPPVQNPSFTFIDLFAGMGGFRIAMQAYGGKCVFSSEWNAFAQKTYYANFGELPFGDITKSETKKFIPNNFDILCAGFPCQPFSIAGVSKKNSLGRAHGFLDKTQGTLFFDVAEIIREKRPKAFFLENVKNLVSHDKGNTFYVISNILQELGYSLHYKVMNGKHFVPQNRERIFIVGFRKDIYGNDVQFTFPELPESNCRLRDILDEDVNDKYTLTDNLWRYLRNYAAKHKAAGNGFGYGLTNLDGISRTLSARYYKDGSEILIPQSKNGNEPMNPRRLTPKECTRLMGYPEKYIITAVSDLQAYKQCGNSVVVPLVQAVSEKIIETLLSKS